MAKDAVDHAIRDFRSRRQHHPTGAAARRLGLPCRTNQRVALSRESGIEIG